jgi:exosortase N
MIQELKGVHTRQEKIEYFWPILGAILCVTGAVEAFSFEFITRSNVLVGLCLLPLVLRVQHRPRVNYVYLLFMLLIGGIGWRYSIRTFYFFTIMLYVLLVAEAYFGRVDVLVWFLVVFMSPFFHQIAVIIGFPVRLALSAWAGSLMNWAGADVAVQGNLMTVHGAAFTVDDACMGLNMLAMSLLTGVFAVAFQGRQQRKALTAPALVLFFGVVFLFNLLSNLLRIVMLVMFRITPGQVMHDITGLVCLAVYVLLPVYYLSRWWLGRWGKPWGEWVPQSPPRTLFSLGLVALACALLMMGVSVGRKKTGYALQAHVPVVLPGFTTTGLKDGVTKLESNEALVYIKPIPEFFSAEHTPLFCWKGSGYAFKTIAEGRVNGADIYQGVIVRGDSKLYTAWWYTNGTVHTISQADWRWRMIRGERRFCLINVTAGDRETLVKKVRQVMELEGRLKGG